MSYQEEPHNMRDFLNSQPLSTWEEPIKRHKKNLLCSYGNISMSPDEAIWMQIYVSVINRLLWLNSSRF